MNLKSRRLIMILVSLYIAYLGFDLVKDSIKYRAANYELFFVLGSFLLLAGLTAAFYYFNRMRKEEAETEELSEEEEAGIEEAESADNKEIKTAEDTENMQDAGKEEK